MLLNVYVAQQLAEERMRDALRKADRRRLIQEARRNRCRKARRLALMSMLKSLLAMFSDRRADGLRDRSPSSPAKPIYRSGWGGLQQND
jgi:hypothetical protein